MRNILKCFIATLLIAIPALNIIACGKNNGNSGNDEHREEKNILSPLNEAKNLINNEINENYRENIFTANALRLNDSDIRNTMEPLAMTAQTSTNVVFLENDQKISENILRILQNDLIASLNKKLKTELIYFANINNPVSFNKDKSRFSVTKVSFDQRLKIISDLKNPNSRINHMTSDFSNINNYYVYKLQLATELDLLLKQGKKGVHNIYLDIYLTQNENIFEDNTTELTELVKKHISDNVVFDLEIIDFQDLTKENVKKQILRQINGKNEIKLNISNYGLEKKLLTNLLSSKTNSSEYLNFLNVSNSIELSNKIKNFITKSENFKKNNPNFDNLLDNEKILLGNFTFIFWNANYFELPLKRIVLKNIDIKVFKSTFETQMLNIGEVMAYYFSKVFSEKKKYHDSYKNSLYLIVPEVIWNKYAFISGENKVFSMGKRFQTIFRDTIREYNKNLLKKKNFNNPVFKSLIDKIEIEICTEKLEIKSIGSLRGYSGLENISIILKFGFFVLNILNNNNFWYGKGV